MPRSTRPACMVGVCHPRMPAFARRQAAAIGQGPFVPPAVVRTADSRAVSAVASMWRADRIHKPRPSRQAGLPTRTFVHTPAERLFLALKSADAVAGVLAAAARSAECDLYVALMCIEESGAAECSGSARSIACSEIRDAIRPARAEPVEAPARQVAGLRQAQPERWRFVVIFFVNLNRHSRRHCDDADEDETGEGGSRWPKSSSAR